jgi:hypothetical protein
VQKLLMVAPLVPAVLDTMDWDKWANESGRISGVDPKLFIPEDQRQAIREARAQAQQQAAMAQMLKDGSQAVKNAGGIEKVRELVGA